jgi:hypothetical protein
LEKLYSLLARKNVSRISLVTTVVITIVLMRIDAELAGFRGMGIFYIQVAFTKSNFTTILSSWRSGGVDLLMSMLWLYYINAASYAVLFASAAAYFSTEGKKIVVEPVRVPELVNIVIPFAAAALDWISNTLLYLIFSGWYLMEVMIIVSSVLSSMKWAFIVLSLALILRNYFSFRKAMKKNVPGAG